MILATISTFNSPDESMRQSLISNIFAKSWIKIIIDKRQVLMESPRISEWRTKYLKGIAEVRRNLLEGTVKCVFDDPSAHGKRIIISHAGSATEWVSYARLISTNDLKEAKLNYYEKMLVAKRKNLFPILYSICMLNLWTRIYCN